MEALARPEEVSTRKGCVSTQGGAPYEGGMWSKALRLSFGLTEKSAVLKCTRRCVSVELRREVCSVLDTTTDCPYEEHLQRRSRRKGPKRRKLVLSRQRPNSRSLQSATGARYKRRLEQEDAAKVCTGCKERDA